MASPDAPAPPAKSASSDNKGLATGGDGVLLEKGAVSVDSRVPHEVGLNLPVVSGRVATSSGEALSPGDESECEVLRRPADPGRDELYENHLCR